MMVFPKWKIVESMGRIPHESKEECLRGNITTTWIPSWEFPRNTKIGNFLAMLQKFPSLLNIGATTWSRHRALSVVFGLQSM